MKKTVRKFDDFSSQAIARNSQHKAKGGFRKSPATEPIIRTLNWGEIDIRFSDDEDRVATRNNLGGMPGFPRS